MQSVIVFLQFISLLNFRLKRCTAIDRSIHDVVGMDSGEYDTCSSSYWDPYVHVVMLCYVTIVKSENTPETPDKTAHFEAMLEDIIPSYARTLLRRSQYTEAQAAAARDVLLKMISLAVAHLSRKVRQRDTSIMLRYQTTIYCIYAWLLITSYSCSFRGLLCVIAESNIAHQHYS